MIVYPKCQRGNKMKIKNYDGRSWISKYDNSGLTIHIKNAEVQEVDLKGSILIIEVKKC